MRDQRFVALHRGGLLTPVQHRLLMQWAIECVEHVLPLVGCEVNSQILQTLELARDWEKGKTSMAEARKASISIHEIARTASDPIASAVARSCGHTVATAHMADHCIPAAEYALQAVQLSGLSVEEELTWQNGILNAEIAERVRDLRKAKRLRLKRLILNF